jgi:hypothetical protein
MIYAYTARIDGKLVLGEIEADCAANGRRRIHALHAAQRTAGLSVLITKIFTPPPPQHGKAPALTGGLVYAGRKRLALRMAAP